jgi:hypothetical protein
VATALGAVKGPEGWETARPLTLEDLASAEAVEAVTAASLAFGPLSAELVALWAKAGTWYSEGGQGPSPWVEALPNFGKERLAVIHSVIAMRVPNPRKFTEAWLAVKAEERPRPSWAWLARLVSTKREKGEALTPRQLLAHVTAAVKADPAFRVATAKAIGADILRQVIEIGEKVKKF